MSIHSGLTVSTKPATFSLRTVVKAVQKKPAQSKVLDFQPQKTDAVERQAGMLPAGLHRLIAETCARGSVDNTLDDQWGKQNFHEIEVTLHM